MECDLIVVLKVSGGSIHSHSCHQRFRIEPVHRRGGHPQGYLVNRVEGAGMWWFPQSAKGPVTIAISTETPGLTKYLRLRLEEELTENYQEMARCSLG